MESSKGKIQVAEAGNKRKNITDEDVSQTLHDLVQWYKTNATSYFEETLKDKQGCSEASSVILGFGGPCSHLSLALEKFDGGLQFLDTFVGLSVAEIKSIGEKEGLKGKKLVPFAKDIDGNLQCVRLENGESVVHWDCDEKEVTEDLKLSFGQYLEDIRDKVLMKKLIYEDGMGLMSVA